MGVSDVEPPVEMRDECLHVSWFLQLRLPRLRQREPAVVGNQSSNKGGGCGVNEQLIRHSGISWGSIPYEVPDPTRYPPEGPPGRLTLAPLCRIIRMMSFHMTTKNSGDWFKKTYGA